ncbi:hypothetical protein BJV78DRAFT_1284693 [Lactifluus subvellereus]|nr:hypothetical protein BJV78DRAFT_1284693 [Lactifluus subvellereus]
MSYLIRQATATSRENAANRTVPLSYGSPAVSPTKTNTSATSESRCYGTSMIHTQEHTRETRFPSCVNAHLVQPRALLNRPPSPLADILPSSVSGHTRFVGEVTPARRIPGLLLAHAYARYLGDLPGGQIVRRYVVRAYRLEDDEGAGRLFIPISKS